MDNWIITTNSKWWTIRIFYEFIGGGWVMYDETTCLYQNIIDQTSYGLK